jgi:MFS family permease
LKTALRNPADAAGDSAVPRLTLSQIRMIGISMLGGSLEFYEFMVFIFMVPIIGELFFSSTTLPWIRQLQTLAIFAMGYVIRPFGGIVLGALGDRLGRKRMFIVTLALMAVPTTCIGLLPTYDQIGLAAPILLLLCRLCQGLAIAGETPTALTFVIEHVDSRRTGTAIGLMGAGLSGGLILGILTIGQLNSAFTKAEIMQMWWRLPFLIGGIFGLVSAILRRFLSETPVFVEMASRRSKYQEMPVRILVKKYRVELGVAFLSSFVGSAIIQSVQLFPGIFFVSHFQFSPSVVSHAQTIQTTVAFFSIIVGNWLMDRIGWMKAISLTAIGLVLGVSYLYWDPTATTLALRMGIVGAPCAIVIMLHNHLTRVFPAEVRITGISTAHNTASALAGGLAPVTMGYLMHRFYWSGVLVPTLLCILAVLITPLAWRLRKPLRYSAAE